MSEMFHKATHFNGHGRFLNMFFGSSVTLIALILLVWHGVYQEAGCCGRAQPHLGGGVYFEDLWS
jgi:hypothetical protein